MELSINGQMNKVVDLLLVAKPANQTDKYVIEVELKNQVVPSVKLESLLYHIEFAKD